MKKFNKNILLFVAVFLIIGFGFSQAHLKTIYTATKNLVSGISQGNIGQSLTDFTSTIDNNFSKGLRYHDNLMDIDSLKNNIINTRIIKKDSDTIVKSEGNSLVRITRKSPDKDLDQIVDRLGTLHQKTEKSGGRFLYVAAPLKGYNFTLPENINNYTTSNYDRFISKMAQADVPVLNLTQELIDADMYSEDTFFITDHHWKPEIGLWASGKICDSLSSKYGFTYNSDYVNPDNFESKTYENYFLGSYGKKTGSYFAGTKVDDISIITPKFATDLTEEQPFKNQVRSGSFTESVMYMENISTKDYYEKNPYVTYSGGDFRLQIIKNNLNTQGKKVLLIRDSFACVVSPFLSLNTAELHVVDLRNFDYFVGEKINVYEYIEKIKPDYVLVLYTGAYSIKSSDGRFDFE